MDITDICEVRVAKLGNTWKRTRGVGTSVIADSLRSEGLPERLGSSERTLFPNADFDVLSSTTSEVSTT